MSEPNAGLRPEVLPEADKVTSLVTTARRLLAEKKMVDLSALDGQVRALCDAIRHVPPEDPAAGPENPRNQLTSMVLIARPN